ncbi:hypothetical protein IAU60_000657 [Kwoniella sp. DSM 27419]
MVVSTANPTVTPILLALTTLTIYLVSGALVNTRASPPFFFTVALGLILAAYVPTPLVAVASIAAIIAANVFFALDQIHGECGYEVMLGGKSWHKERLGELAWHRQCVEPSQAWWIMSVLGLLWTVVLVAEVYRRWRLQTKAIYLPISQAETAEADCGRLQPPRS